MSVSITEEFPRYEAPNPFKYSKIQLAQRTKALRDMHRDYPNLPESWLEMVYDYHENTPKEEVEQIINEGKWEGAGMFSKVAGGTIVCGQIIDPSGNEPNV